MVELALIAIPKVTYKKKGQMYEYILEKEKKKERER